MRFKFKIANTIRSKKCKTLSSLAIFHEQMFYKYIKKKRAKEKGS